jgi:hypothetical protein
VCLGNSRKTGITARVKLLEERTGQEGEMILTSHKELQYGTFRQLLEIVLEEWKFCVGENSHGIFDGLASEAGCGEGLDID